jgi:hypothetical protein
MDDLMNMLASDESPADISDAIKNILHTKAAAKIDAMMPHVSASMFNFDEDGENGDGESNYEDEDEEE